MAMILDTVLSKFSSLLTDFIHEEVMIVLGEKKELQKLLQTVQHAQCLVEEAGKRKFEDLSIRLWFSEHKDAMFDAEEIFDLCRIKGAELLADQNSNSRPSPARCMGYAPKAALAINATAVVLYKRERKRRVAKNSSE